MSSGNTTWTKCSKTGWPTYSICAPRGMGSLCMWHGADQGVDGQQKVVDKAQSSGLDRGTVQRTEAVNQVEGRGVALEGVDLIEGKSGIKIGSHCPNMFLAPGQAFTKAV